MIVSYLLMANLLSLAVGFAIGVGVALAGLKSIEKIVQKVFVPGGNHFESKIKMGAFGFAKYLSLAVIIAVVVKSGWISLPAFACGVAIPSTIIFLKTLAHYFHTELEFHPFWGNPLDPQKSKVRVREIK